MDYFTQVVQKIWKEDYVNIKPDKEQTLQKKHLPVELVYIETFCRIDWAFYREKQIQNWSHSKKEALINGNMNELKKAAECKNDSYWRNFKEEN